MAEFVGGLTLRNLVGYAGATPVGDLLLFFFWHVAIVVPGAVALLVLERFGRALFARRWSHAGMWLVQLMLLVGLTAAAAARFMHQLDTLEARLHHSGA